MKKTIVRVALLLAFAPLAGGHAGALTPSCQADLDKHGSERLAIIQRINAFGKKRPTAKVACSTFGELVASEAKMLQWMDNNKDWCQIPEPFIEDFRKGTQGAVKARGQVCTAAKREAAGAGAAPRGPQPGSGIPLPKGAL